MACNGLQPLCFDVLNTSTAMSISCWLQRNLNSVGNKVTIATILTVKTPFILALGVNNSK